MTDPPFGAKSGRRVLRQANSFFHEDAIAVPAAAGRRARRTATFEAWVRLDPQTTAAALSPCQLAGGKKVWWGEEPTGNRQYGGGAHLGTRKGPLPAPGAVGEARRRRRANSA